ncbi:MAG TPA: hypothetical protein VGP82_15120 [Ktedonobacterales bacterium]|nr:hypothetical protein [Ktedonobacterales bacterium]
MTLAPFSCVTVPPDQCEELSEKVSLLPERKPSVDVMALRWCALSAPAQASTRAGPLDDDAAVSRVQKPGASMLVFDSKTLFASVVVGPL